MVPRDYVEEVISSLFEDAVDPKISVVGVGGAGGKMVSTLYDRDIKGVETIAVNTDPSGLSKTECDVKILLGHAADEDRIAGARASAEDQEGSLRDSLSSDIVFVVAGLGGAAGTGAAPIVARAARANGAVTIGVAILPFEIEGRTEAARQGLEEFRREADSVIVVENDSLNRSTSRCSRRRRSRRPGRWGRSPSTTTASSVSAETLNNPPPNQRPPARASGDLRRKAGSGPRDLFLSQVEGQVDGQYP